MHISYIKDIDMFPYPYLFYKKVDRVCPRPAIIDHLMEWKFRLLHPSGSKKKVPKLGAFCLSSCSGLSFKDVANSS